MEELSSRYSAKEIEEKWYKHWETSGYFHSTPDEREPFTIVIPPPNVTGFLHMGHMLNNTIQDILIRKARLDGKNACWVPGTDHASIATEAKVVGQLREKGIKKSDITRDEFMEHAFAWKDKYGGIILEQLKKLGASCDWERTRFTMEPSLYKAVIHVFVDLHKKGQIYRGLRMTNWDPEALTVLSNEEVIYHEENSQFFHIRYAVVDNPEEGIVIATQRPETIMADVAIAVHPDDERYQHLVGKQVYIPLINRAIPIIADTYVEIDFGTGALKITPAHDQNDNEVGKRHNLPVIDILNANGTLNEEAQILIGEDRFVARKKIKKLLEESGNLVKVEDYVTKIGRSERTNAVVEPRLTLQWFLDMKKMAASALEAVRSGEVQFVPDHFWNMYQSWLNPDNVRDWCISRQLWWGQRVPAWYLGDDFFVAETAEEALAQAREKTGNPALSLDDLHQDEDVLDTWFSSWLWPISVFDGFERQDELAYYYPTNVLVTGWDIMFFWVARMIMSGYEWAPELLPAEVLEKKGRQPFSKVYFTGMVRDNKRRKMSKSLGNSPDALALLDIYGADGVRFGMLSCAAAGNDIIFDAPIDPETKEVKNESKLCEQGRNFCNKLWNALRLITSWPVNDNTPSEAETLAATWMQNKLQQTIESVDKAMQEFRLSDALMELYKFIWDDFCSWYLEMIKPAYGESINKQTLETTSDLFEQMMVILHPFMPFITEEIWHQLKERKAGDDIIVTSFPKAGTYNPALLQEVENAKVLVSAIREMRSSKGLKLREEFPVYLQASQQAKAILDMSGLPELVLKMASIQSISITESEIPGAVNFLAGPVKCYASIELEIDVEAERAKLQEELSYNQGFVESVRKKLSNEKFVANAKGDVVERERQKLADGEQKIKALEEALAQLG